jgi:hypothetical protein
MRTRAMVTTVAWLLGGCTFTPLVPAPPVPDAPSEQAAAPPPEPQPAPQARAAAAASRSYRQYVDRIVSF